MIKRRLTLTVLLAVAAVAGAGGAALAQGAGHHHKAVHHARHHARSAQAVPNAESPGSGVDGDQVQDQTSPDQPGAGGEQPGSEQSANDGPGGHADEPGNASADHQFQGTE